VLPGWCAYAGMIFISWGTLSYIRDIRRGTVQPNLVTWFLWSLAPLIALAAQLRSGGGTAVILTATVGFCPLMVFLYGLRRGSFRPTTFDWLCGLASLVALVLWQISGSGMIGVLFSIAADALGAIPTLRKTCSHPQSESPVFFGLFTISAVITLLTITEWSVTNAAFAVYIFVLYAVLYVLARYRLGLRVRRRFMRQSASPPVTDL